MQESEKKGLISEDYYLGVMEAMAVAWHFMPDYQQPTSEQVKKLITALDELESELQMKMFSDFSFTKQEGRDAIRSQKRRKPHRTSRHHR